MLFVLLRINIQKVSFYKKIITDNEYSDKPTAA